jgi:Permuted papain-like amidase enzyme, YaeF/YiiX, C92 family
MSKISARTNFAVQEAALPTLTFHELEGTLCAGDIIFTRIRGTPFRQIADATGTWTNHVGIVVGFNRFGAVIAESRVPLSRRTRFRSFVRRSAQGRVAVLRLPQPLSDEEIRRLQRAARSRLGRFYDTGFNLRSRVLPERVGVNHASRPTHSEGHGVSDER